ncbi:hypothetical protein BDQ12DRAFT_735788 [Crucibulum laeve]|uniref:F-box domain-containing protein n=1 Tax=Crucibulum laeve TaxID=68775 RepID=A0A5C3MAN0_9AGAR|nr:hypothetical protein BDQ12DRAFT_735788 [Crucibulum laeve]
MNDEALPLGVFQTNPFLLNYLQSPKIAMDQQAEISPRECEISHSNRNIPLGEIRCRRDKESGLLRLPLDLHLLLLSFLDPPEIFVLRKTCKTFYPITLQRTVWTNALRRVNAMNCTFDATYPIDKMQRQDLEYAAISPFRWLAHHLQKRPETELQIPSTLEPYSKRILKPHPESPPNPPDTYDSEYPFGNFYRVYLVPGGRFLISSHFDCFCVWDLGYSPKPLSPKPWPLAFLDKKSHDMLLVRPTPDGLGIRMFISAYDETADEDSRRELAIYDVYPLDDDPEFKKIASLRQRDRRHPDDEVFTLAEECLVFVLGESLTVWNFINNTYASWNVKDSMFLNQIISTDAEVLLFDKDGVSIYTIPPLQPLSSCGRIYPCTSDATRPYDIFLHVKDKSDETYTIPDGSLHNWYDRVRPIMFQYMRDHELGLLVSRFTMDLPTLRTCGENPQSALNVVLKCSLPEDDGNLEAARLCNDNVVMLWMTKNGMKVHVSPFYGDPTSGLDKSNSIAMDLDNAQSNTNYVTSLLAKSPGGEFARASLCPVSGRLCYIANQHEVHILDYVAPPPGINPPPRRTSVSQVMGFREAPEIQVGSRTRGEGLEIVVSPVDMEMERRCVDEDESIRPRSASWPIFEKTKQHPCHTSVEGVRRAHEV